MKTLNKLIASIEKYTGQGRKGLDENELIESHVLRQLEIIGEAVRHLPQSFKSKYPFIPWKEISGMREMLIQQYFYVNKNVLWGTIEQDIPQLQSVIETGIKELGGS